MNIDTIEKLAQIAYDPRRLGGTMFPRRRVNPMRVGHVSQSVQSATQPTTQPATKPAAQPAARPSSPSGQGGLGLSWMSSNGSNPNKKITATNSQPSVSDMAGFKQQYTDMVRRFNSHVKSNRGRYSDRAVKDIAGNLRNIYSGIGQNATPAQMQKALSEAERMMGGFRSQRQIRPGDSITVKGRPATNGMQTSGAMKGWNQFRPGIYWKPGTSGNRGGDERMAMRSDPSGYAREMLRIADRAMLRT